MPLKEIAARFGIALSTASVWTRDIELTDAQREWNRRGHPRAPQHPDKVAARAQAWQERCRAQRRAYQDAGRARARENDPLHLAGCMLYWAEGHKDRNRLRLTNSDPHLLGFFCRFVRECFGVPPADLCMSLHVYLGNGLTIEQVERHWLDALDLPASSLRKHSIDPLPTSSSGIKRNKLPYGVCTVAVARSTALVQHVYGAIQEYAGFEEPAWLDGRRRSGRRVG